MQVSIMYPRGCIRQVEVDGPKDLESLGAINKVLSQCIQSAGDPEVIALYNKFNQSNAGEVPWDDFIETIQVAMKLLPNGIRYFATLQRTNGHCYGHTYQYILDTINYITTGNRTIQPRYARELMDIDPPKSSEVKEEPPRGSAAPHLSKPDHTVAMWLRNKDGYEDLIETLYTLFGD